MTLQLRPFEDQDFDALVDLAQAATPFDPEGIQDWLRHRRQYDDQRYLRRHYLVEDTTASKQVVGYGAIEQQGIDPGRYRLLIVTETERFGGGAGDVLFARLMQDLQALGATSVWVREYTRNAEALAFLREHGFQETRLVWDLRLSVDEIALETLLPLVDRATAQGVLVYTLAEERYRSPECVHALHELFNTLLAAEDQTGRFEPVAFERFARWFEQPDILPSAVLIARHGPNCIGFSVFTQMGGEPDRLVYNFVGVQRKYRHLEVAAALGALTIIFAHRNNYRTLVAHVPQPDLEVLAWCESLGFQRRLGYVTLEKALPPINATAEPPEDGGK